MVDRLKRHWKSDKYEGLTEFMKATDVGFALRNIVPKLTIYEEIIQDGDEWTIAATSTFKNHKYSFKMGVPFTDNTPDGKTMKTTITIEGNKIVSVQENIKPKEIPSTFTREVLDDGDMLMTVVAANGVTCKRWFKPYNP